MALSSKEAEISVSFCLFRSSTSLLPYLIFFPLHQFFFHLGSSFSSAFSPLFLLSEPFISNGLFPFLHLSATSFALSLPHSLLSLPISASLPSHPHLSPSPEFLLASRGPVIKYE